LYADGNFLFSFKYAKQQLGALLFIQLFREILLALSVYKDFITALNERVQKNHSII
jgi:hypothetical protein